MGGVFFVDRVVMPNVVGINRDVIDIPSIVGLDYNDARNKLYGVGLLTEISGREFDDNVPEGAIISQYPESGGTAKKGRKIAVALSRGKEVAVLPVVRGLKENQARLELKKMGFSLGKVKKTYSAYQPVDEVIDLVPPGGTTISRAMDVDLLVSRGPRPTHAEVPNVIGENITEARKKIEESGLSVGKVDYQNSATLVPGTVMSQSVAPGSKALLESSLNIVVSVIR
jgi:serine/threonine-protein kinase